MKLLNVALLSTAAMFGAVASDAALAHGGHPRARVGVFISAPVWGPWWYHPYPHFYHYPYYGYPPVVTVPGSPPVYVEQGDEQPGPQQRPHYWYYCPDSKAYYPYVKECPGGWQRVTPQPPPPS